MKKAIWIGLLVLLTGCATTKLVKDPTFAMDRFSITERADGTTLTVTREFKRIKTVEEFDLLTEAEKLLWNLLKKQLGF